MNALLLCKIFLLRDDRIEQIYLNIYNSIDKIVSVETSEHYMFILDK